MNHLLRELAPINEDAWASIEDEAKTRLTTLLAARKLVDFEGPHGWSYSATNLGRVEAVAPPAGGIEARQRRVLPLVELRVPFSLSRGEVDDAARGATNLDWSGLEEAAFRIGEAENAAVFNGYERAGMVGIAGASSHGSIPVGDFNSYPTAVAMAVNTLRTAGIGGPFGLAISPTGYTGIIETTEHGGYLLLDHLHQILDGPVVWTPGIDDAVVLSLRGGDFTFDSGQDLSIGYLSHDEATVRLYLEESFSFHVDRARRGRGPAPGARRSEAQRPLALIGSLRARGDQDRQLGARRAAVRVVVLLADRPAGDERARGHRREQRPVGVGEQLPAAGVGGAHGHAAGQLDDVEVGSAVSTPVYATTVSSASGIDREERAVGR